MEENKRKFKEAYSLVRLNQHEPNFDPHARTSPTVQHCGPQMMDAAVSSLANRKASDALDPKA